MKNLRKKIKTVAVATAIVVGGGTVDYYAIPRIEIYDAKYTPNHYQNQLKPEVIGKIKNRDKVIPTAIEAEIWKSVANHELRYCKGWTFDNASNENIVDLINKKIETGSC